MKIGFSFAKKTEVRKNIGVQPKEVNPDVKTEVIVDIEDGKITSENPTDEGPLVIPCSNPLKLKRKREDAETSGAKDAEAAKRKKEELDAKLAGLSAEDREAALALFKASGGDVDDQEDVQPIMMQSKFSGLRSEGASDKEQLARESALLPEPSKDQFDAVPVEQFGIALLRGMGYDPKKDTNKPILLQRRSGLAGLGATNLLPGEKPKEEEPQKAEPQKPVLPNDGKRLMLGYVKPAAQSAAPATATASTATASTPSERGDRGDRPIVAPAVSSDATIHDDTRRRPRSPAPRSSTPAMASPDDHLSAKDRAHADGDSGGEKKGRHASSPSSQPPTRSSENAALSEAVDHRHHHPSSSSSSWLSRGLLVKMINKGDAFFKCKGVVLREEQGRVKLKVRRREDGPSEVVEDYPARYLETVISRDAERVRIVTGSFRGEDGKVLTRNAEKGKIKVRIRGEAQEFDFDEACEFV